MFYIHGHSVALEKLGTLYHGSPRKLKTLALRDEHGDPRVNPAVFASPSRNFALAYAGRKWGNRDLEQSTRGGANRRMLLREMAPGAFQRIYGKKKGYLYTVPEKTFHALKGRRTSKEVVSYEPVQPLKTEIIPDVLKALRAAPGLDLHTYDPKNPATRAAVKRDVRRMREMDDSAAYEKWRLEHAPPEIKEMFFAIWTTGIPNVGAGYATGNAAARPGSAALLARDLSTIAKEHQGRWTKHLAVDTRHFTPTQIKSTPLYDEASLVGRSPYYEKIITPEAYNAAPVLSRYKPLPDGAFTRTQGDILLGKKAV